MDAGTSENLPRLPDIDKPKPTPPALGLYRPRYALLMVGLSGVCVGRNKAGLTGRLQLKDT
jgi:hypothetical protein